jgi:hypothetical protein
MPNEQLRNAVEALRASLQRELDAQLSSLTEQHEHALEEARKIAEGVADARWTAKLDATKSEWAARLETELSAARAEADLRLTTEVVRLKAAAEQAAVEAAARTRVQVERAAAEAAARAKGEAEQAAAELAAKIRAEAADEAARAKVEADQAAAELAARMRAEAEQVAAQLTTRLRSEAEQSAALAAVRVREEADRDIEAERQRGIALLDAERQRSAVDLNAERQRVGSLLDAERQRLESELLAERQRAEADRVLERQRFDAERQQLRSERHRIEAERQTLLLERDRLLAEAQEKPAAAALVDSRTGEIDELGQTVQRLEAALEAERQQAQRLKQDLGETRASLRRVEATLEEERQAHEDERQAHEDERQAHAREAAAPALSIVAPPANLIDVSAMDAQSQAGTVDRLFGAMRAMDAAKSLTEILAVLVQAAATEASRAAIFIGHGDHLQGHKAVGFTTEIGAQRIPASGAGLLAQALQRRETVIGSKDAGGEPPAFAALPLDRTSLALPIAIGGEPVAVLYADDSGSTNQVAPASWPEAVQILGSHAASCLAHLTATRSAQAMRLAGSGIAGDENSAKRYARLLVSEIKLYNEAAVRVGRENRDLLDRLRPEIERARKLYEERVPAGTGPQDAYFHQELVQTLADGDAALLGEPA